MEFDEFVFDVAGHLLAPAFQNHPANGFETRLYIVRRALYELILDILDALALRDIVEDLHIVELPALTHGENRREQIEERAVLTLVDDLILLERFSRPQGSPQFLIHLSGCFAALEHPRILAMHFSN